MNYKVLYRKYRPKTFDEIVGQNNIITLLKDSIINNKISHAYIFSGPRGTGKTSTAKIFAKAINCIDKTNGNPCLNCEISSNFNLNNDKLKVQLEPLRSYTEHFDSGMIHRALPMAT